MVYFYLLSEGKCCSKHRSLLQESAHLYNCSTNYCPRRYKPFNSPESAMESCNLSFPLSQDIKLLRVGTLEPDTVVSFMVRLRNQFSLSVLLKNHYVINKLVNNTITTHVLRTRNVDTSL